MNEDTKALKEKYGPLFDTVSAALFAADPMHINFRDNTDEYDLEAGSILARLDEASTVEQATAIVHEEFCKWFTDSVAGPQEKFSVVTSQIWDAWSAAKARAI
jgi:hypothetical protein